MTAASTNTSRSVGRGVRSMSVPRATICSAMRTGASRSGPPPGWPKSAPRSSTWPSPSGERREREPGHAQHREVAVRDRTRRRWRRAAGRRGRDDARVVLPRDDVRVRHDEVRSPATKPVPSWMPVARLALRPARRRARDARRRRRRGCRRRAACPASGDESVSNTSGKRWSPTSRPRVSDSDGGSGATPVDGRARPRSRAPRAPVQPGELASAGMSSHMSDEHAGDADDRARDAVARCTACATRPRSRACERGCRSRARSPGAIVATTTTNASDAEQARARRRAAAARRRRRRRTRPPSTMPTASPAHDVTPSHEPHPVADPARARGDRDDDEVEEVHAAPARAAARG